jgi:FkbH-like protein
VTTADVTGWMTDPACYTQFMRLRDRFGDSGLTGVLVAFREEDVFRIDTWLMSCRVLGRRIETAMLASLCEYAIGSGARAIVGEYIPTEKNEQVKTLYDRLGFEQLAPSEHGTRHELRLDTATLPSTPWFDVDDSTAASSSRAAGRTRDEL